MTSKERVLCAVALGEPDRTPLAKAESIADLAAHRWPSPDWFDFSDFAERLKPWEDFAIMATGASVWQHPSFLRSLEALSMDLIAEPETAVFLLDKFTGFYVEYFDRMLTAAHGRIDLLRIADDIGTQQGLMLSPLIFREMFAPRIKRIIDMAHSHGVKVIQTTTMKHHTTLATLFAVMALSRVSAEAPAEPPEPANTSPAPLFRDPVFDGAGDRSFIIYFTHPYGQQYPSVEGRMPLVAKRSSIQAAELEVRDGKLACDRDRPFRIDLGRP